MCWSRRRVWRSRPRKDDLPPAGVYGELVVLLGKVTELLKSVNAAKPEAGEAGGKT